MPTSAILLSVRRSARVASPRFTWGGIRYIDHHSSRSLSHLSQSSFALASRLYSLARRIPRGAPVIANITAYFASRD